MYISPFARTRAQYGFAIRRDTRDMWYTLDYIRVILSLFRLLSHLMRDSIDNLRQMIKNVCMKHAISNRTSFLRQRAHAERRGIPFRLTFEEWWSVWEPHWARRDKEHLDMCRMRDLGAYELGNVRIDTHEANTAERVRERLIARLPHEIAGFQRPTLPQRIARLERHALELALGRADGNMTNAALRLGISFRQFRYLCKRHKVTRNVTK